MNVGRARPAPAVADATVDAIADPAHRSATDPAHDPATDAGRPVLPRYGSASLADLLPAVLSSLDLQASGSGASSIVFPKRRRVCVLLIDGLGLDLLQRHPQEAPFLSSLLADAGALTVGFPSTTATSLSSLGTGQPPGIHGLLGFEMYVPELGRALNCLRWDAAVDPVTFQPLTTAFERAAAAGVAVTRVGPAAFDGAGLTESALRGGIYARADYLGQRVAAVSAGLRAGERALVYAYYGDLDATGHAAGCDSPAWRYQLAHADRLAEQVAQALPPDGLLLVTADHGMLDVPFAARTDVATVPELNEGLRLVSGEPRALYVHTVTGAADDVLDVWCDRFADYAWVVSRDQAVDEGWFGPTVAQPMLERIGNVIVAAREPIAVVDSRTMPAELLGLVGLHGSLTAREQIVPLLPWTPS